MREKKMPAQEAGKPFVKWAGGKRKLLSVIECGLPQGFDKCRTYIEPFTGGGAVFFYLRQHHRQNRIRFVLNDLNSHLITTYKVVRDAPEELILLLTEKQRRYNAFADEIARYGFFLSERELFNQKCPDETERAALFIFLNKTCFNGLYRENSKGEYNVSFGKKINPLICDEPNIRTVSRLLKGVILLNGGYEKTECYADGRSFFYLDPPYKPISETSSFCSYTADKFGDREQAELAGFCRRIDRAGAAWMMSNSDVKNYDTANEYFDELYRGYQIKRVQTVRDMDPKGEKNKRIVNHQLSSLTRKWEGENQKGNIQVNEKNTGVPLFYSNYHLKRSNKGRSKFYTERTGYTKTTNWLS